MADSLDGTSLDAVFDFLDVDKNGTLDYSEWVGWRLEGTIGWSPRDNHGTGARRAGFTASRLATSHGRRRASSSTRICRRTRQLTRFSTRSPTATGR